MNSLDRKLLRDLGQMKGQVISASLVMSCGLTMMIMTRSLIHSLESARASYYERYRFGEIFCNLKRAPNAVRERLARIPGVAALQTGVVGTLRLDLPAVTDIVDGLIISIPGDRANSLNEIFLRAGRLPERGSEVVVSEPFALAHSFRPGDTIGATVRGARERLEIVGIGLSPENVFEKRSGESLPDSKRFGVLWMNERDLAVAYGLEGAFNNVVVDLAPGADSQYVIAQLNRILGPYGGLSAYDRRNHSSDRALNGEIEVLKGLSVAFPVAFLGISTFMLAGLLTRTVQMQREQIAQLKSLGYSARQVGTHYLKFSLVIVALGLFGGVSAGVLLGSDVVALYNKFFRFPSLRFRPDYSAIWLAAAVSLGSTLVGVSAVVFQAMRLPPAEAMRPRAPAHFRPSFFERTGANGIISRSTRMALRNLERKPLQASFTALGLALAAGIPVVPGALRDGINHLVDFQWTYIQRQDVTVSLTEPASASAFRDLQHLSGVVYAEPFRSVPVRLHFGHRHYRLSITGVSRSAQLTRALDENGRALGFPTSGLLISRKLAEILGARAGDRLLVEFLEGRRGWNEIPIHGLIADYRGLNAIMDIDALRALMLEGETISGAYLRIDSHDWSGFLKSVERAPRVASLGIKSAMRESFRKSTVESITLIQSVYFIFSITLAFGVVYTGVRISLSERSRDLATLRIAGFTYREVAHVMIGELAILTAIAIPAGLWIGGKLARFMVDAASTEYTRLPLVLTHETYATAILIVMLSAGISFAIVSKEIRNLDLLSALRKSE